MSRGDFKTRRANAGPDLAAPGAQCIGDHTCELAITTDKGKWIENNTYRKAEEYHAPLQMMGPASINSSMRIMDAIRIDMQAFQKMKEIQADKKLPYEVEMLNLDNPKITITTIKKAERDDNLILRLLNLSSETQEGTIRSQFNFKNLSIVNLNEEKPVNPIRIQAKIENNLIKVKINPHVIATLKIEMGK